MNAYTPASTWRLALENIDVEAMRRIWANTSPHLPQPKTHDEILITIHMARTSAESIHIEKRAYSHRWLLDRGYRSLLPDRLLPSADRLYPKLVKAVGIANGNMHKDDGFRPLREAVQSGMEYAVEECFADGHTEKEIVTPRMFEARTRVRRELLGRLNLHNIPINFKN